MARWQVVDSHEKLDEDRELVKEFYKFLKDLAAHGLSFNASIAFQGRPDTYLRPFIRVDCFPPERVEEEGGGENG